MCGMRFRDLPVIQGVIVEIDALRSISHRCDPRLCRGSPCCGSGYEVCVEEEELPAIVGAMPLAARFAARLRAEEGLDNVFDELWPGLYSIDTDDDGLCLFASSGEGGRVLCSLHCAALSEGIEVRRLKPRSCRLWPLAMTGSVPRYLGIDPGAFDFPCNSRRPAGQPGLDDGIAEIVRDVLGEEFLRQFRGHTT